jgi:tetratricopeptide (TPR) repeat protein
LIDEIKRPLGRWTYIREEKKFLDVIRKIREQIERANEITESSGQRRSQDLTPTPTPVMTRRNGTVQGEDNLESSSVKNIFPSRETVVTPPQKRVEFWRSWIFASSVVGAVILILAAVFHKNLLPKSFQVADHDFKELRMKGLDRIALKKFGMLNMEEKFQSVALDEMAGLLIAYERRGPDLKRYIQQQLQTVQAPDEKARYQNFLGIALLQEQKFDPSFGHFQKAFEFGPLSRPVEINMGLLELTRQNYEESFRQFRTMLASRLRFDEEQRRLIDLGFMLSFYRVFENESPEERKKQYKKFETEFDRIFFDTEKDYFLSFERAFLLYQTKSLFHQENIDIFFDRVLSRLLHPITSMRRSDYFYWNWLDWAQLSKMCKVHDPALVQDLLLKTICDLNNHRDEDAELKLKDLATRSDSHLSTLITLGNFLFRIGRTEEARSQVAIAVKNFPKNQTALHLLGMICMELQDKVCAQDSFNRLLALNSQSTDAFLALSRLGGAEFNLQALEVALPQMDRLHYFPYLEWKAKVK